MDLLLIGGVSGSGKSVALAAFEDAGYYAVNILPVPLVVQAPPLKSAIVVKLAERLLWPLSLTVPEVPSAGSL